MATELSKNTKLKISVETLISIGAALVMATGVYYSLEGQIAVAMESPKQDITRTEFDLRIEAIGNQVIYNGDKLEKIETQLEKLDERLYEISTKRQTQPSDVRLLLTCNSLTDYLLIFKSARKNCQFEEN